MAHDSAHAGFTLGEIVTVIAIVMILSAIVVIVAGPQMAKSKTEPACESNLHQIAMAYNMYLGDNDDQLPPNMSLTLDDRTRAALRGVDQCPLTHKSYWDNVQEAISAPEDVVARNAFPDGRPIPYFDQNQDVLYRCLDHGFGGFLRDTPSGVDWQIDSNTRGTVLGVRLNGTVAKVAPISCWQFRYEFFASTMNQWPSLWRQCDRP